jgi:hypothetical protein
MSGGYQARAVHAANKIDLERTGNDSIAFDQSPQNAMFEIALLSS